MNTNETEPRGSAIKCSHIERKDRVISTPNGSLMAVMECAACGDQQAGDHHYAGDQARNDTDHPDTVAGLSQCDVILETLRHHPGEWVSLWDLFAASHSMAVHSRINDLRHRGHEIEHRNEWVDGKCHSSYRLLQTRDQGPRTNENHPFTRREKGPAKHDHRFTATGGGHRPRAR